MDNNNNVTCIAQIRQGRKCRYCDQTGAWIKSRCHLVPRLTSPRRYCVRWGPSSTLPKRGQSPLPNFRPMSIVAKGLDGSRLAFVTEVGLGPGNIVLDGNLAPSPSKGAEPPPQFSAYFYCGQSPGCTKMPLGMEVGLGPGDFVFDGEGPSYPWKYGHIHPTQFLAHVCCGQTAGWIKMRLDTEVDLGSGDVVLDGVPAPPPPKGHSPPVFGPCLLWPNG